MERWPSLSVGDQWDVLVVGAGPAGLTAALYSARAGLKTVVLERGMAGGQIAAVDRVENYPGFATGISGAELAMGMERQAREFGAVLVGAEVTADGLDLASTEKQVAGHRASAVILATGAHPRKLGIPGEDRLWGRGVSYCATCDGAFFRGKPVMVIGGGDSAVTEALYLTRLASRVCLVHRRAEFRAAETLVRRLTQAGNADLILGRVPVEIVGEDTVERVVLRRTEGGPPEPVEAAGVFVYVGMDPETEFLRGHVDLDPRGYVITDEHLRTRVPGVYAAGDVRIKELRQVVTAAADGAVAAMTAEKDLTEASAWRT